MPPGTSAARVAAMRAAFLAMVRDPKVRADAAKAGVAIDRAQTGDRLLEIVADAYETPPAVLARLQKLKADQQGK
jgi:tripartite-type tricarboxylate transporter receptor subunit TctC